MADRFDEIRDYYRKSGSTEYSLWTNSDLIDRDTEECIRGAERDLGWLISEVERLRAKNEQVRDELNGCNALIDTLNMIAPDKMDEAIDIQKESEAND